MPTWFERDPALLATALQQVAASASRHPVFLVVEPERAFVRGAIVVADPITAVEAARYSIEIALADDHPNGVPTVRETDGRVPWTADRHNSGGRACVFVEDERWRAYPRGGTLTQFIDGPVFHYFLWQAGVELTGNPPFRARAHGDEGVREFYEEAAGTNDPLKVLRFLFMLADMWLDSSANCYCGSHRPLEDCHVANVRTHRRRISRRRATQVLRALGERMFAEADAARARRDDSPAPGPPPARVFRLGTRPAQLPEPDQLDRLRLVSDRTAATCKSVFQQP